MTDDPAAFSTDDLIYWVLELQAGRPNAAGETFDLILSRVAVMAHAAIRRYPRVHRFAEPDDIVQAVWVRLLRAFREVRPTSRRHFYALVNELIRRELLDLTKKFYGPAGAGTHLTGGSVGASSGDHTPAAPDLDLDLDQMTTFHEALAELPDAPREVLGLVYYHGWPQADIAAMLQVSLRTVQRLQHEGVAAIRSRLSE